jgi:hypothetical protein
MWQRAREGGAPVIPPKPRTLVPPAQTVDDLTRATLRVARAQTQMRTAGIRPLTRGAPIRRRSRSHEVAVHWRRIAVLKRYCVVTLAALSLSVVAIAHRPMLRTIGDVLIVDEQMDRADVIVLAADALFVGADVDAAELVAQHVADRAAVFTVIPNSEAYRIRRHDATAQAVRRLERLGVPRVDRIPAAVTGTTDSMPVLVEWCRVQNLHSVLIITNADHSRRVRRVLDRALVGTSGLTAAVHVADGSPFRPDDWWTHRGTILTFARELPKLMIDTASHPNL